MNLDELKKKIEQKSWFATSLEELLKDVEEFETEIQKELHKFPKLDLSQVPERKRYGRLQIWAIDVYSWLKDFEKKILGEKISGAGKSLS